MKIKCWGEHKPHYGSEFAAGIDLYNNGNTANFMPNQPILMETKISVEIPEGYVGLVFVRSSIGKRQMTLTNGTGIIDSDYRGQVLLNVRYSGDGVETIEYGERFAQMVIVPYYKAALMFVDELSDTDRGTGGFGSTGKK